MTDSRQQTADSRQNGVTLLEILVASILGVVVALAMGQVDVSRMYHSQEVRGMAAAQSEAGFAVTHMTKQLALADRINLISSSNLQLRIPPDTSNPADFDNPANYVWKAYTYNSAADELRFYDPAAACILAVTFRDISAVTITQIANNTLQLAVASTNPYTSTTLTYTGQATLRAGASDVTTGLADASVSPPPASCP